MTEELDQDSTFTEEIEHDPNICTNCYRRIRFRLTPHETMPDTVSGILEYPDSTSFAYFEDKQESGNPSVKKSYCECGFVDEGKIRPLSKNEMTNVAKRVHERLREKDIEHDEDKFFSVVRDEKSDPEMQFNEEKILEKAIEKSMVTSNGE